MKYLLDTNIISHLIRDPKGIVRRHIERAGRTNICTSVIVAAELKYGLVKKPSQQLSVRIETALTLFDVMPLDAPADEVYGTLRADLERRGAVIGANDLLIAAHALALGFTLVTDNVREFQRVSALKVENWLR